MNLRDLIVKNKNKYFQKRKFTSLAFMDMFYDESYDDHLNVTEKLYKSKEAIFREYADLIDEFINNGDNLSESFLREFSDKLNWESFCECQNLPENFIRDFADKVDWETISHQAGLSEGFIREFSDKLDWGIMSETQTLPEDLMRKFSNKIDFRDISCVQVLSEGFIHDFAHKVCWEYIARYQLLSTQFIVDNWDRFKDYFPSILKNKKIKKDKEFFLAFCDKSKSIVLSAEDARALIDDKLKDPNWQDCLEFMGKGKLSTFLNLLCLKK